MEFVDSGREPHLDQPLEALTSGTGDQPATGQNSTTAESHDMNLDALSRRAAKRRTKTGCLTCRKRRIKCGEEKPICSNCIKSKRECEGYAQRLVFKRPVGLFGALGPNQQPNPPMQSMPMTVPFFGEYDSNFFSQQGLPTGSRLPILAPRPTDFSGAGESTFSTTSDPSNQDTQVAITDPFYYPPATMHTPLPLTSETAVGPGHGVSPARFAHDHPDLSTTPDEGDVRSSEAPLTSPSQAYDLTGYKNASWVVPQAQPVTSQEAVYHVAHASTSQGRNFSGPSEISTSFRAPDTGSSYAIPTLESPFRLPSTSGSFFPTQGPPQAAYDYESDDYYDVESDDEMLDQEQSEGFNQLSLIMASANRNERQLRSFTTHLNEPNILASYRPTFGSSPLNNPKTARIFVHFLHSTAPSLSIFERHPTDSSIMLGAPVPTAQQGLWTYTLPLLALADQALLQAILAVGSLHISFLQRSPPTPSLKHYHYALKRIGAAVSLPLRRKQIGTLAAILLLGYYEVIAAEYTKWSSHMGGSAQLIRDIDFAGTTRDLRAHRRKIRAERGQAVSSSLWPGSYFYNDGMQEDDPFAEKETSVDEGLVGSIMGRIVNYDKFGQVDDEKPRMPKRTFTRKDIENFRIQCDLYWWYIKQDIIQTLISGNKLFTPYYKWSQCPPRAGIGRLDAVYGSADHLWLLLARLADFGYRDRRRKLKAIRASGVEWGPSPELAKFMARFSRNSARNRGGGQGQQREASGRPDFNKSPSYGGGQTKPPPTNPKSNMSGGIPSPQVGGRPMYGMIPPLGPIRLGTAFANSADRNDKDIDEDEDGQDATYKDAEHEWENILSAFDTFAGALGRDYLPLPEDSITPISTPFGPALQYRTSTIAVIWGYYYAGRIMLQRFHPSMPPAMMVASGVAKPVTDEYAQTIGKIAGGVYYPQRYNFRAGRLNPNLGSSLVELTVPIYFSAVQYTDAVQRAWVVTQVLEVARLTGWESANVMVRGCESAWVVAAKQGRGPPYERIYYREDQDTPFYTAQSRDKVDVGREDNSERRFVAISKSSRNHWAMGILSLEDDISNLDLED